MPEKARARSILFYGAVVAVLVTAAFALYGYHVFGELERLRFVPTGEGMESLQRAALRSLGILFGLVLLLLFATLKLLATQPLRSISMHISRLIRGGDQTALNRLACVLPVAEATNIRASLDEYHSSHMEARRSLEKASKELRTLINHDVLTGARNRGAFDEYLRELPGVLSERRISVCFALFDVNHFKAFNDTYGHQTGDEILKLIASRISGVLRRGEHLFRVGGDEFAVIMLEIDEPGALRFAERCLGEIGTEDFTVLGVHEPVKVSVGIAGARFDDPDSLASLQWCADIAMHNAKRPGNANISVFRDDMAKNYEGIFSSRVNTAVYEAITLGTGLVMLYQPVVDLNSGQALYYEALVRIRHNNELIMPAVIFPLVEARHLEVDLDQAVLKRVLEDLRSGRVQRGSGVAINLSGPTIVNKNLSEWIAPFRPMLTDYRIVLEVTETSLITQVAIASENLSQLRGQGFEIALDDFGSGYSSFRYLATMPVDTVKFDISLIRSLGDDSQRRIVEHLVAMISEIGHRLIAEGIEDEDTLESVRQAGFTLGQGYFFGHPSETAWRSDFEIDNVFFLPDSAVAVRPS
ncbi:MAG: bifunctional diguanylate cyclase/phosphodiesterase [Gammaproteobacteria bacterium]